MNPPMDLALTAIFVSPIINFLITKVSTPCYDKLALVWGVKGALEKLAGTLEEIDEVLLDAEKQQVQSRRVNLWLERLKYVVLDAEDVLAELEDKDDQIKMEIKTVVRRFNISRKIEEVNTKLEEITKSMKRFKFVNQLGCSDSNTVTPGYRSETSSLINDSAAIVGRKDDKTNILDLLGDCNEGSYSHNWYGRDWQDRSR